MPIYVILFEFQRHVHLWIQWDLLQPSSTGRRQDLLSRCSGALPKMAQDRYGHQALWLSKSRYTIHRVTHPMALSCRWCSSFCCMLQRHLRSENQQKKRKRCSENPCVLFILISRYLKHCHLSVQGLRVQSSQLESTLHTVQIRWNILNSRPKQKICERSWTSSLVPKLQFERERARSLRFMTWLAPLGGQLTHGSARAVTRFQVVLKLRKESSFDFLP